ncbi:hypothetical protein N9A22_04260 [Methylophilaceae bacterium]|nr:hypothetical protein [Methylophilaceae bacterium]
MMRKNYFNYSISWRSKNYRYGNHLSSKIGNDFEYSGSKNFNDHPDLSSIDIKNSITDPYENIFVKTFNLNNPINLVALCDISSSMFAMKENNSTIKLLAKMIASSAVEHGDMFSMVCYNDAIKNNLFLEPGNNIHNINQWVDELAFSDTRATSENLLDIVQKVPNEKSLIFWISDFHHSYEHIDTMIEQLSNHHVIPIHLSTEQEIKRLPNYGFTNFMDSEMNVEREIFLRPKVKDKLLRDYKEAKEKIFHIFAKNQLMQLELDNGIDMNVIQQYFMRAVI